MSYLHEVMVRAGDWLSERLRWLAEDEAAIGYETTGRETIEFFGGPLDGLRYQVDAASVYRLPPAVEFSTERMVEVLDADDTIQLVEGTEAPGELVRALDETRESGTTCKPKDSKRMGNPITLYDLVLHESTWQYHYGGQLSRN